MFKITSLRTKFTILISVIIILVLSTNTMIVLRQKYQELNQDTFRGALSFSRIESSALLERYQVNEANSFLKVPGEVKSLLELNADIKNVKIINYDGNIEYDFQQEKTQKYTQETPRDVKNDKTLLDRIQANLPSIQTAKGQIVYIEQADDGRLKFQDGNGKVLSEGYNEGQQIENLVYPLPKTESTSLLYEISYDTLNQRIYDTTLSTVFLTVAYIFLGILIAFLFASRIVQPIKKLTVSALNISKGRFGQVININSKDEVGTLAKSFNKMSLELKAATDQLVQKERLAKEIELASKIQDEFLPKQIPSIGNLEIHAAVIPADAVGGDCYDFIELPDDKLLFYIGDVTGHGVSAGLITAIANSLIYSLSFTTEGNDPREISLALNKVLRAKTRPDMFITIFIAIWDAKTNMLTYTPCGHEPTYVFKKDADVVQMLKKEGIALGMVDHVDKMLKKESIRIDSGDVIIQYTDGIPEAWNSEKQMYGFQRLEESMKKHIHKATAKEIYDGILEDVYKFMAGYPQADDVTLVVMKKN